MSTSAKHCCIKCNYSTASNQSFQRHLQSVKHKELNEFKCKTCGCFYKHKQSLFRHVKECNNLQAHIQPNIISSVSQLIDEKLNEKINEEVVQVLEDVIVSNKSFQENVSTSQIQMQEIYGKLVESHNNFVNVLSNNNNILLENVTSIVKNVQLKTKPDKQPNNGFNLDNYLNETCKDAINIEDFIINTQPTCEDVATVGNYGYVEGNSEVILKYLKNIEKTKRPIQCSDLKRQTVYLKTQGKWEKDDDELKHVCKVVNKLCHKTYRNKSLWEEKYPECQNMDSKRGIEYILIVKNTSGNGEDTDVLNEKIAKKIIKSCVIDKNIN